MKNKVITKVLGEIFATNRKTDQYSKIRKLRQYINKFSNKQFDEFVQRLLKHPLSHDMFNYIYTEPSLMFSRHIYVIDKMESEFIWFKNIFIHYSDDINYFLEKQRQVDISILNSKPIDAINLIEEIEQKLGSSLWSIEYTAHIKRELLGENSTDYLTEIKSTATKTFDFFMQQLIYKSESKNIYSFIDNLLAHINLMRLTENHKLSIDFADLFATYFLPIEFDKNRNITTMSMSCFMNFSIIDQYNLFKKYVLNKKSLNGILGPIEEECINEFLSFIDDNELHMLVTGRVNMSDINNDFMEIIKMYTNSSYTDAKSRINLLLKETPYITVFTELYAKNNIYLDEDDNTKLFNKLSNRFGNIMLLRDSDDAINYIEKIATKFNFSTWKQPLLYQLYSLINSTKHKQKFSVNNMIILGNNITPKSAKDFSYKELFSLLNVEIDTLPYYRKIKINSSNDDLETFYREYEKNSIIKVDYLKDKAEYLINDNKLLECASFLVNNYLDNELSHYLLPIEEFINKIELEPLNELSIDIPIIYDIYCKKIKSDKAEERSEAYEDYINQFNTYKPSEAFMEHKTLDKKELYFLKYVAIPLVMDISSEFDGSIDLKKERLEILNLIKNATEENDDALVERNNLFDELVFEKLKASFNSSKIYVDVESLKSDKEYEYKRLYDIFISSKITYVENDTTEMSNNFDTDDFVTGEFEDDFVTVENSTDEHVLMPISDLSDVIVQIYKQLIEDFVKNEDYGLDKYLSTEIRHDVFFTQLRTSIEKYHLLTETELYDDNIYSKNEYWLNEYQIFHVDVLNMMDNRLKEFSKNIDFTIKEANDWFLVIDLISQKNNGMFDFLATYDRLKRFKYILLDINNFNDFMEAILSFMWSITYEATDKIKKRLQEDLKEEIIGLIDTLHSDINSLTEQVSMERLSDAISLSRGSIIEEIDNISSWLNKVEDDNKDYSIVSIIKECTNMFKLTFVNKHIDIEYKNIPLLEINLSYLEARAIMNSIFITLDNVIKYGLKEDEKYLVQIEFYEKQESNIIINIKNKFCLDENSKNLKQDLKEKLSDKYKKLSKKESGGTGLHKIYNLLSNVSNRFFVDIDIINDEFIVIIGVRI